MKEFSPTLARGLRRDLFRLIDDNTREDWQTFRRRRDVLIRSYGSVREACKVYGRARAALRSCCLHLRNTGNPAETEAVVLLPGQFEHPDGSREDLLQVLRVGVAMDGPRLSQCELRVGVISQHAVERLFLRMATTSTGAVLAELKLGATWMSLLQLAVVDGRNPSRVRNMPVPTLGGVLLCRHDPATASFNVRTWLRRGMSARLDATVDALHGWVDAGRGKPPDAAGAARRLDALIDDRAHRWIQRAHRPSSLQRPSAIGSPAARLPEGGMGAACGAPSR